MRDWLWWCGQKDVRTEEKALLVVYFKPVQIESKISKHILISLLFLKDEMFLPNRWNRLAASRRKVRFCVVHQKH
jgi:hypothetical protein